jgi:hypothetical protein
MTNKVATLADLGIELHHDTESLLCSIINSTEFGGEDGRPLATPDDSLRFFSAVYVCACVGCAFKNLTTDGQNMMAELCKQIRDEI